SPLSLSARATALRAVPSFPTRRSSDLQVVVREVDGEPYEPVERLAIDVPEEYVGVVTQLLALRKGNLEQLVNHGTGWARLEYRRSEEHTSELQSRVDLVCRLLLEKKNN